MKFCRKGATCDTIKSQKKQDFTISLEDTYLEKPHRGSQIDPLLQSF